MNARFGLGLLLLVPALAAQNSTRRIRPEPGPLAARAGSAVQWRGSVAAALEEAERSGRPVFWYVPTVVGSPMDRKAVIDMYMMAGPFSWPRTIALLNDRFVPVKAVATGRMQRRYGLTAGNFIEPGFLVLDGDGRERYRLDKISTLHPDWFEAPLRELVGVAAPRVDSPTLRSHAWRLYAEGGPISAEFSLPEIFGRDDSLFAELSEQDSASLLYLKGAIFYRTERDGLAFAYWRTLAIRHPEHPLAWKAAAEIEGHGPFARGFEDYRALPPEVLAMEREGSQAPSGVYTEGELWSRSVAYLLGMQRMSHGYEDSRYDFGGTDSLPNVHMACTALVGEALLEAQKEFPAANTLPLKDISDRLPMALWGIRAFTMDVENLNSDDSDELIWAQLYRARFLARSIESYRRRDEERLANPPELDEERAAAFAVQLQRAVDAIQSLQPDSGAWFHEYQNPFVTAAVLIALKRAKNAGATIDETHVDRGIKALLRARANNGAYAYASGGSPEGSAIPAAAGRMPVCELALTLWGEGRPGALENALRAAFAHHDELEKSRKYDDHAGPHAYGGFFFWFDMHGRSEAIAALPDGDLKERLRTRQRELILSLPEFDGAFVDSHELGRPYATAMALLSLAALR